MEDHTVRFVLELQDYKAMTVYICAPASKRSKTLSRGVSFAGVVIATLVASRYVESFTSFMLGMFFVSVLLFAVVKIATSGASKQLQPDTGGTILCEYNVALTAEGVSVHTAHWDTLTRWSGVLSIDQSPEHAFIRIDRIAAYTIPKRAFPDEEAFRRFIEQGRAYIKP